MLVCVAIIPQPISLRLWLSPGVDYTIIAVLEIASLYREPAVLTANILLRVLSCDIQRT